MSAASEKGVEDVTAETKPTEPFLSVVKGDPSDEELAALVVVLSAAAGSSAPAGPAINDQWGAPTDLHRPSWGMPTSYLHGF